jgi:hypothetical protein
MKITVTNIKKILEKEYGWFHLDSESHKWLVDEIIEDTLKIIDDKLKYHKNDNNRKNNRDSCKDS